jgi:hypothetical protein
LPAGVLPLAGAAAPQIPALLFSVASWPMAGPGPACVFFLMPTLAWDHRDPNASPPDGFAAAGPLAGLAPPSVDDAAGCCAATACTDEK